MAQRHPFTPAEFDAVIRRFEGAFGADVSLTSGHRSFERNAMVGGNPQSKHLYGMARDYATKQGPHREFIRRFLQQQGLWFLEYDWGFHIQGLPIGPIPRWWADKYLDDLLAGVSKAKVDTLVIGRD